MERIESKSISVSPVLEQEIIRKHELFGWNLRSSQEVFHSGTHHEMRSDELWEVKTTTNYVKLVFQRDLSLPNIMEIKELEEVYWENFKIQREKPRLFPGIGWCLISLFLLWLGWEILCDGDIILGMLFCVPVIGLHYLRFRYSYVQVKKDAQKAKEICKGIEDDICVFF